MGYNDIFKFFIINHSNKLNITLNIHIKRCINLYKISYIQKKLLI